MTDGCGVFCFPKRISNIWRTKSFSWFNLKHQFGGPAYAKPLFLQSCLIHCYCETHDWVSTLGGPKISWIWSFSGVWCTCGKKHLSGPCYWWRTSENLSHFTIFVFVWTMFGMLIFCFPQNNFLFVNMGTFFFSGIKTFHFIPHIWCGGIKDSGQGIVPFYSENFTVGVCLHSWEYNENYF